MRRREREINIFNIAFLDVITGAMGAFVLLVMLLAPYYSGDVTNQQHEAAVKQSLDLAAQALQKATTAARSPSSAQATQTALAQAQKALDDAHNELQGLRQQLDQLVSQNRRVKTVDDNLQAQLKDEETKTATAEDQAKASQQTAQRLQEKADQLQKQLAELEAKDQELQRVAAAGTTPNATSSRGSPVAGEQKVTPLVVTISTPSCNDVWVDLYVWSRYKPDVKGQTGSTPLADPPFDPSVPPRASNDAHFVVSAAADSGDVASATHVVNSDWSFAQWILDHADWRSEIRIFYVLRKPLSYEPLLYAPPDLCRVTGHIVSQSETHPLKIVAISHDDPVVLAAVATIASDGSLKIDTPEFPGTAQLSEAERRARDAWLKKTEDVRNPLAAAQAGRMTQEIHDALQEEYSRLLGYEREKAAAYPGAVQQTSNMQSATQPMVPAQRRLDASPAQPARYDPHTSLRDARIEAIRKILEASAPQRR